MVEIMTDHQACAKMHCAERARIRLNRIPTSLDFAKMRLALLKNNADCFLRREYPDAIIGIVRLRNIWTVAVYDRNIDRVVTVGVQMPKYIEEDDEE